MALIMGVRGSWAARMYPVLFGIYSFLFGSDDSDDEDLKTIRESMASLLENNDDDKGVYDQSLHIRQLFWSPRETVDPDRD